MSKWSEDLPKDLQNKIEIVDEKISSKPPNDELSKPPKPEPAPPNPPLAPAKPKRSYCAFLVSSDKTS